MAHPVSYADDGNTRRKEDSNELPPPPRDWSSSLKEAPVASETFMDDVEDLPVQERQH